MGVFNKNNISRCSLVDLVRFKEHFGSKGDK